MNRKDTFWFRHDSNAKDDPKCVLLIEQLGLEGYGIYWMLVEVLREQPEYKYPLALIPALARRYNTTPQKVEAVVTGYGLFQVEDEQFFFSRSLLMRMKEYNSLIEKRKAASKLANETRWAVSNASQTDAKRIPNASQTESVCDPILSRIELNRVELNRNISSNEDTYMSSDKSKDDDSDASKSKELKSGGNDKVSASDNENDYPVNENPSNGRKQGKDLGIPFKTIAEKWNDLITEHQSTLGRVVKMSETRKAKVAVRWREMAEYGEPLQVLYAVFDKVFESKFLQGDSNRGWRVSFDWIFENDTHWLAIYEGKYSNPTPGGTAKPQERDPMKYVNDLWK